MNRVEGGGGRKREERSGEMRTEDLRREEKWFQEMRNVKKSDKMKESIGGGIGRCKRKGMRREEGKLRRKENRRKVWEE